MTTRAVPADQLAYLPPASPEPAPDVDMSVYGVAAPTKQHGRLYQSMDFSVEMEDQWRQVELASSDDKEQVCTEIWSTLCPKKRADFGKL